MKDFTMKNVHSIGNGQVCVYGEGAGILDWIAPYYSAPTLGRMTSQSDPVRSERRTGTAVWTHSLADGAVLTDITVPDCPAFLRGVRGKTSFTLRPEGVHVFRPIPQPLLNGSRFTVAVGGHVPCGTLFYKNSILPSGEAQGYPVTDRICAMVAVSGGEMLLLPNGGAEIVCENGELLLLAAQDEETLWKAFARVAAEPFSVHADACVQQWRRFTTGRLRYASSSSRELALAADDIAVLLKTQQDASGGVLAGCNYHLSYVRDNFGVFRGMLASGCMEEARGLLQYYIHTYEKYGRIQTAQGMGVEAFHVHEHDFAENTGYIALMAAELSQASGASLEPAYPMLRYVLARQHERLAGGVLPFSGDETYIAGGILPRSQIGDGSMEATLLYHRALERLLPLAERDGWLDASLLAAYAQDRTAIERSFAGNFMSDGVLWCNAPGAWKYDERMRPGVRECGHGFGLSYRSAQGRYVCLDCLEKSVPEAVAPKRYDLLSTAFTPVYVGSRLVPTPLLRARVQEAADVWAQTGRLPSGTGERSVGYDFGMLLLALSDLGGDVMQVRALIEDTLAHRDRTGAWVEYYDRGLPAGTPCRPWESAVNLYALLHAEKYLKIAE